MGRSTATPPASTQNSTVAIGLSAAALALMVVFAVIDVESAVWLIVGVLGLAGAVVGWRAGGGRPRGLTLAATVVGAVLAIVVVVWGIVGS